MLTEAVKVLLVEDNLGDARLLHECLMEALPAELHMVYVRRLSEALECLWGETYDAVLLDLGLPDSHGLDTLIQIRARAPRVPIVVLTGFDDEATAMKAVEEGAQDYLVKGKVDSKLLARSLGYAIARHKAEEAVTQQAAAQAKAGELQLSPQRLISLQEGIRRDLAAHLQTGIYKRLLALEMSLQQARGGLSPVPEPAHFLPQVVDGLAETTEREPSSLKQHLYPSVLDQGLVPALSSLADQFNRELAVETEVDGELGRQEREDCNLFPEAVRLAAYRIAEEALSNVVKHARATRARLRLDFTSEGWLRITIWDDGRGFNPKDASPGQGISIMKDYAEAVGGERTVRSSLGRGTEVTALLPLAAPWSGQAGKATF